jgi:hypothetical protein
MRWIRWWWLWVSVRKREARGRAGAKSDETERNGSVSGVPCETAVEGDGVRWWDEVDKVVVVVGLCVRKCEAGGGAGAKSDETKRDGLVSGAPCETAVESDGGRWWDEVDKVVVVVGLCVRKCEAGGGAGAKSDETKRDGLVSGAPCETAVESDGGRWWDEVDKVTVVVGLCVHKREAGGGAGAETEPSRSVLGAPCETSGSCYFSTLKYSNCHKY